MYTYGSIPCRFLMLMNAFDEGTYQVWCALISTGEYASKREEYLTEKRKDGFIRFTASESQEVAVDRSWKIRIVVRGGATLAYGQREAAVLTYLGPDKESYIPFNIRATGSSGGSGFPIFEAKHLIQRQKSETIVVIPGDPWSAFKTKYWKSTKTGKLKGKSNADAATRVPSTLILIRTFFHSMV